MRAWVIKASIQKVTSFLPYRHKVNSLLQKYVTKGLRLADELFDDKLNHCKNHLLSLERYSSTGKGAALEIGTGWYPIVPIGLYLSGFGKVVSIDLSPLTTSKFIYQTIEKFITYYKSGRLNLFLPNIDTGRMEKLHQISADRPSRKILLGEMNIELVVGDARRTEFPEATFDLICSNNTFEHIPLTALQSILLELNRILKPSGVMSNNIDMSDHFAHFDRSISNFNFLKFSERQWRFIDNSLLSQNRLRLSDFLTLFQECGFKTLVHEDRIGNRNELSGVTLDKKFTRYVTEDLLVTHSLIVSRKGSSD